MAELGVTPLPPFGEIILWQILEVSLVPLTEKIRETVFEGLPLIGLTQEIIILPSLEKENTR